MHELLVLENKAFFNMHGIYRSMYVIYRYFVRTFPEACACEKHAKQCAYACNICTYMYIYCEFFSMRNTRVRMFVCVCARVYNLRAFTCIHTRTHSCMNVEL
jgi:hypothetical protein